MTTVDDMLAGPPCKANKFHWGGRCPLTHEYHATFRAGVIVWHYQTFDSFYASSAANAFVNNEPVPRRYRTWEAALWFAEATRMGIVFA